MQKTANVGEKKGQENIYKECDCNLSLSISLKRKGKKKQHTNKNEINDDKNIILYLSVQILRCSGGEEVAKKKALTNKKRYIFEIFITRMHVMWMSFFF